MNTLTDFSFEKEYCRMKGDVLLVGVDEAGRGPLAGPVVAVAAHYKHDDFHIPEGLEKEFAFIRDSKTLSEKKREEMFAIINEYFDIGVGIIYPETIDRVNILQATFLAMKEAVGSLKKQVTINNKQRCHPVRQLADSGSRTNTITLEDNEMLKQVQHDNSKVLLLIDGNQKIPNLSLAQETVVSGDKIVKSIAAASIIAKVTRDRMMNEYDAQFPQYGFKKHKGYGTKVHMEALKTYGPTPIHRVSFAPVAQAVMWFKELGIIQDKSFF